MQRAMPRRMEDEIRELCKELLAGKDDDQQIQKLVELRAALRLHIERLRSRLADHARSAAARGDAVGRYRRLRQLRSNLPKYAIVPTIRLHAGGIFISL